jgi:hypothetical protein
MALRSSRSLISWLRGISPTMRIATKPCWPVALIHSLSCSLTGRYRCSSAGSQGFHNQPSIRPSAIAWLIGSFTLRSRTPMSSIRRADGWSWCAWAKNSTPVSCGIHWSAITSATGTSRLRSRSNTPSPPAGERSVRIW